MDLLFFTYGAFFYFYGVYLHCGYELEYPDAHHPILNTSFQHMCHHSKSLNKLPYHTGFFLKIWDNLFGSVYDKKCFCAKCAREEGLREEKDWKKYSSEKPDYSKLLELKTWIK